ncbi:MAG: folate-binding protein [Neisseriaceae bacterium]|nr:folate-binding protein [Neisseriaceae bacterium]
MLENPFYANLSSHFGVIRVTGEEAATFLQGQLSNDIRLVTPELAQYSTYSTPKGRMLANFLIWQADDAYFLLCRLDLLEPTLKRLKMYVMRSKVTLEAAKVELWGINEAMVAALLGGVPPLPQAILSVSATSLGGVIQLGLGVALLVTEAETEPTWPSTAQALDSQHWQWVHIAAGLPWISAATVEAFVPQMANMDALGAIHFKKGCYTGQEVVARLHYLGKSKRRLYRIGLADDVELAEGADLYGRDGEISVKVGQIVNIAPDLTQEFGQQALAVVQIAAWETGIFADAALTQKVSQLSLPYEVKE